MQPTILRTIFLSFGILPAEIARADLLLGNFASSHTSFNTVLRYREDGTFLGVVGTGGETTHGISLGSNGNLYVVSNNLGQGRIEQFNPVTGASLGALVSEGPTFQDPNGITFGIDGNCYSTSGQWSSGTTGVIKFDGTSGAFLGAVIATGSDGLGFPNDVLKMPGGDLLVSDGSRINRYNGTTLAFEGTFVAPGSGGIAGITKYTFGPDGDLYLSSWGQNAVFRFDGNSGAFIDTFVSFVERPLGLTFGEDGQLYVVSNFGNASVLRFDGITGASLGTFLPPSKAYAYGYYLITVPEPASVLALATALGLATRRIRGGERR